MRWFKKHFGRDDYSADQEKFAALHFALKGPQEMIMLAGSNKPIDDTVYLRMPAELITNFPGYHPAEPPTEARVVGLYGDQSELLRYIKIKP